MVIQSVVKIFVLAVTSAANAQLAESVEPPATEMLDGELVCDDGGRPFVSADRPRWSCEIEGCTFMDDSCNHDENICYDQYGNNLLGEGEVCPYSTTVADGALESFKNFLYCDGSYYCEQHNSLGLCIKSVCVEELLIDLDLGL